MSLPDEERRALRSAWRFLLDLGSSGGPHKRVPAAVREEARRVSRRFPLGGDPDGIEREAAELGPRGRRGGP